MAEIKKAVLGSVRLDSDVWEAVRAMDRSLNMYLRETLIGDGLITPEIEARIAANIAPRRAPAEGQPQRRGPRPKGDKTR